MCGIVGYIGRRDAVPVLLEGLRSLEYRGYDSAGVAFVDAPDLPLVRFRAADGVTSIEELGKIADFSRSNGLRVYIDGARLANAAATLDCSLAAIAEYADVLSFGATKNGAMGAEALIVTRPDLAADVPYLRKQQTQLASKMRFVAAQLEALLRDELWRSNADHANAMARRLAEGVAGVPDVQVVQAVQANAVFAQLPARQIEALRRDWFFHSWDEGASIVRWMTAFDTPASEVDAFVADIKATAVS